MCQKLKKDCLLKVKTKTCLIIGKDGEFLVGASASGLRWSQSPYDAWSTRDKMKAFRVSWAIRGRLFLFNPIVGQLKSLDEVRK